MRRSRTLLALLLPSPALAEPPGARWEPVEIEADDGSTFAIRRDSIERDGPKVTLRTSLQRREPSPSGLFRTTGRWRYDCAVRTAELLDYEVYGQNGEILETMILERTEIEPVQPETAHDFILRAIC